MEEITRMRDNLLLIRRTVGWTAEKLGDKIGVTRQTINNIENKRNRLTKTQYIVMCSVLDAEIAQHPNDTEMLKILLDVTIDQPDHYNEQDHKNFLAKENMMAPSILAGTSTRADVSKEWMKTTGAALVGATVPTPSGVGAGSVPLSAWLIKVLSDNKKNSNRKDKNNE